MSMIRPRAPPAPMASVPAPPSAPGAPTLSSLRGQENTQDTSPLLAAGHARAVHAIEMLEYVKRLGFEADKKKAEMLWIAEEGIRAPLPPSWAHHLDKQKRTYFHNTITNESTWENPNDKFFREIVDYQRRVFIDGGFWNIDDELAALENRTRLHLTDWLELFSERSEKFYHNRRTNESRVDDPKPALCHGLYMKSQMVTKMKEHLPLLACASRMVEDRLLEDVETQFLDAKHNISRLSKEALRIQTSTRALLARNRFKSLSRRVEKTRGPVSEVCLSMHGVGMKRGKELQLRETEQRRRHRVASQIQAHFRGEMARTQCRAMRMHHEDREHYAKVIQCRFRAKRKVQVKKDRAAGYIRFLKDKRIRAVVSIQRRFRGNCVRAREGAAITAERNRRKFAEHRWRCILRVQAWARMLGARREVQRLRELSAEVACAREASWSAIQRWICKSESLLVLQRQARVFSACSELARFTRIDGQLQAYFAVTLDERARGLLPWTWRLVISPLDDQGCALDEPFRPVDLLARSGISCLRDTAAIIIQCFVRQFIARRRVRRRRNMVDGRSRAAVQIQARARGVQIRARDLRKAKYRDRFGRGTPLWSLQAQIRRCLEMAWIAKLSSDSDRHRGVSFIQRLWRGWLARRHRAHLLEERAEIAISPLRCWFDYKATGPDSVQIKIQTTPNPIFDQKRYFIAHGDIGALGRSMADLQREVELAKDNYLWVHREEIAGMVAKTAVTSWSSLIGSAIRETKVAIASVIRNNPHTLPEVVDLIPSEGFWKPLMLEVREEAPAASEHSEPVPVSSRRSGFRGSASIGGGSRSGSSSSAKGAAVGSAHSSAGAGSSSRLLLNEDGKIVSETSSLDGAPLSCRSGGSLPREVSVAEMAELQSEKIRKQRTEPGTAPWAPFRGQGGAPFKDNSDAYKNAQDAKNFKKLAMEDLKASFGITSPGRVMSPSRSSVSGCASPMLSPASRQRTGGSNRRATAPGFFPASSLTAVGEAKDGEMSNTSPALRYGPVQLDRLSATEARRQMLAATPEKKETPAKVNDFLESTSPALLSPATSAQSTALGVTGGTSRQHTSVWSSASLHRESEGGSRLPEIQPGSLKSEEGRLEGSKAILEVERQAVVSYSTKPSSRPSSGTGQGAVGIQGLADGVVQRVLHRHEHHHMHLHHASVVTTTGSATANWREESNAAYVEERRGKNLQHSPGTVACGRRQLVQDMNLSFNRKGAALWAEGSPQKCRLPLGSSASAGSLPPISTRRSSPERSDAASGRGASPTLRHNASTPGFLPSSASSKGSRAGAARNASQNHHGSCNAARAGSRSSPGHHRVGSAPSRVAHLPKPGTAYGFLYSKKMPGLAGGGQSHAQIAGLSW